MEKFHFDDVALPPFGVQVGPMDLIVHDRSECEGRACVVHAPSDHHMRTWPTNYRADVQLPGFTERTCPHGVGHPDPDDLLWHASEGRDYVGVHGCDGCCRSGDLVPVI